MGENLKILHIEDIKSDAELVERTLKKSGIAFEKLIVDTEKEYVKALDEFSPDIILSDHSLPAFNSLEALRILQQTGKNIPFILITATVSEEFAVNVMKEGASDYVLKDRLQRLPNAVVNAIEKYRSDAERQIYLSKVFASEALFTKAELIAGFGTWRIELATGVTNWSAGTYLLLGYQPGEVAPTHDNFLKNVYADDLPEVEDLFETAGKNHHAAATISFRVINSDGSTRYVRSQFEYELDEAGKPAYLIGFNQDVTQSALAQEEIQKNLAELQAASDRQSDILNALPPNVVLLNEAGKIVAANDSWKRFTLANNLGIPKYGVGYSYMAISEKATGVDELSAKKIASGIKDVIEGTDDEFSMEYSCYTEEAEAWFQIIVAPLTDKTKKGAVVLHIDITDRKLAEELRIKSEANLQTIFENTDIAYVLCNAEHKIVSFNSRANEFCLEQFDKKLKTGAQVFTYFPKNKIPNFREAIQKVEQNEMVSYETSYNNPDDSSNWYEVRWIGVANEKKANIGFILAFKNINERKVSELERNRITADLFKRNKDLEQFTYIVSHNLRAPVANIMGLSNMLNSVDFDIRDHQEVKTALSTSIRTLDQMILDLNHILQVSTYDNEKKEMVSLGSLVEDIRLNLHNLIADEKINITCNFNAADKMVTIKSYMHSIFYNLILNAIKYRRPDTDTVISIYSRKDGDNMEILFNDNGKGVAEKNFGDIFGLYKRFDSSVEGKGMGLFMVKMQAETLGGEIDIESEPGSGTTFRLKFTDVKYTE